MAKRGSFCDQSSEESQSWLESFGGLVKRKVLTKVAVLPDIHAPLEERNVLRAVLDCVKFERPDLLIQLGDLVDFNSISRFDVAAEKDLIGFNQEVEGGKNVLDQIDGVVPKRCRKVILKGNHCKRPEMYRLNRWDKNVQAILGIPRMPNMEELLELKKRRWEFYQYGSVFKFGKCLFKHGGFVNIHHALKNVTRWFETVVYGHTHQWQVHCVTGRDRLPVAGMSIGTLSRFDLPYLYGEPPNGWVHMFMMMDFFRDGTFTPHPITIINGRFAYNSRVWR